MQEIPKFHLLGITYESVQFLCLDTELASTFEKGPFCLDNFELCNFSALKVKQLT